MKPINVLSCFDGMSCGQIALKRAGIPVKSYHAFEIDKYAIQVTQKNYPKTVQLGDINNWREWIDKIPVPDLLIAGSPCQGFSNAGKGLNFDDPRSKLFFTFWDILNYFKKKNPNLKWMLENVKMKQVWSDLISDLVGLKPVLINSALVSAQNRQRLYWANWKFEQPKNVFIFWKDIHENNAQGVFYYTENSFAWINKDEKRKNKFKLYTSDTVSKMQMLEASHYKGYSNQRCFGIQDVDGIRYIAPVECERLQTVPEGYTSDVSNTQRYKMLGNGWTIDVVTHIFKALKSPQDY